MKASTKAIIIGVITPTVVTVSVAGYAWFVKRPKLIQTALDLTEAKFSSVNMSENYKADEWKEIYKNMNFFALRELVAAMENKDVEKMPEYIAKIKEYERSLDKSGFTKAVEKNNGLPIEV